MSSGNSIRFVTLAVANGLASALALASAIAGNWLAALIAVATSYLFAAGMIPAIARRSSS